MVILIGNYYTLSRSFGKQLKPVAKFAAASIIAYIQTIVLPSCRIRKKKRPLFVRITKLTAHGNSRHPGFFFSTPERNASAAFVVG